MKEIFELFKIRWAVILFLVVLIQLVMRMPGWGEWYAETIYPPVVRVLSFLTGWLPFSVGDCFIYGSILFLIVYLLWNFIVRRCLWAPLGNGVEYLFWVYIWFYLAWGLNYFRDDFYERAGLARVAYSEDDFRAFLDAYTDALNTATDMVLEGDSLREPAEKLVPEVAPEAFVAYGLTRVPAHVRPKPMLLPGLMSGVGVTGYMGPFFSEFHLNQNLLPSQYPFTYVHELSHLLGCSNEAEANFHAYRICVASSDPWVRFSGYFALFPYVAGNAWRALGAEGYSDWLARLRPAIPAFYEKRLAYWASLYNPQVGEAQEWAYNMFLRGNRISSGTANYAEVIALIIADRKCARDGSGTKNIKIP